MIYNLSTVNSESRILTTVSNRFLYSSRDSQFDEADEWVWISWEQKIKESQFVVFLKIRKLNSTSHDTAINSSSSVRWSISISSKLLIQY